MIYSKKWVLTIVLILLALSFLTFKDIYSPGKGPNDSRDYYSANTITDTGAVNQVTAILFDYRGFDTLGEATVIFAVATIISIFAPRKKTSMLGVQLSILARYGVALILPFLLILGFYVAIFGHISPGGGFTGGVIIAASSIIFAITYSVGQERNHILSYQTKKKLENTAMILFICIGLASYLFSGYFLANKANGIPLGQPGRLLSGGLIPLLNLISGIKVGAGLAIIFNNMVKED